MPDILLFGEGPDDLGRRPRHEEQHRDGSGDYEGCLEILLRRYLEEKTGIPSQAVQVTPRTLKSITKHGGGLKGKVLAAMASAQADEKSHLVVVIDRDRNNQCWQELESGRDTGRQRGLAIPTALGCCVETLEAWLLADHDALRSVGLSVDGLTSKPEELDGKPKTATHPKVVLSEKIGLSETPVTYQDIAQAASLDEISKKCPKGFGRFISELESEFRP